MEHATTKLGWYERNTEWIKERRLHQKADPAFMERERAKERAYYIKNKEKIKIRCRKLYARDKLKMFARTREKYNSDPYLRANYAIRRMLRQSLTSLGERKIFDSKGHFGCTLAELQIHLQRLFKPEWNWENRGKIWDVDHIIPLSYFRNNKLSTRYANHFTNLQPLDSDYNQGPKQNKLIASEIQKVIDNPLTPLELLEIAKGAQA